MRILMVLTGTCFVFLPMLGARRECQVRARRMKPRRHLACSLHRARFRSQRLHWEHSTAKGNRGLKPARNSSAGRLRARIGYVYIANVQKDTSGSFSSSLNLTWSLHVLMVIKLIRMISSIKNCDLLPHGRHTVLA